MRTATGKVFRKLTREFILDESGVDNILYFFKNVLIALILLYFVKYN